MKQRVALVIGAGIAGPAVALFLKTAGFVPLVFEAHSQDFNIGGALQVAPNGMHILQQLGLARPMLEAGVESAELCFKNQFGKSLGCIPNGPASIYGIPGVQVVRSVLHKALLDELISNGIPIQYSKRVHRIELNEHGVTAEFEDGTAAEGSILIGADGIHSRTRQIIFPSTQGPHYTGLVTIGGFASNPVLRATDVKQRSRTHMIFGQNGFFGYGYCDNADPSTVMWWSQLSRNQEPGYDELRSATPQGLQESLQNHHRGWAEPVGSILQSATRILWGPIHDLNTLQKWSHERVVLIGDAAHAISPHAGQGVSLALEDAITLAKHLRSEDYRDAFRHYQQDRQERVNKIVGTARKRGDNKHALPPTAAKIRDFMMSLYLRFRGGHINDETYGYRIDWQ
jgi:2-polyprenyl-6-methoxyphenol hydroxylase-like FAD-dependent oxidoreductase